MHYGIWPATPTHNISNTTLYGRSFARLITVRGMYMANLWFLNRTWLHHDLMTHVTSFQCEYK